MGFVGSSTLAASNNDTVRTIYNITLGPVNTEQSQTLPPDTKGYLIRTRGNAVLKLAFILGESGTNYITIPKNSNYEDLFFSNEITLYFQSQQTADLVEIIAYS